MKAVSTEAEQGVKAGGRSVQNDYAAGKTLFRVPVPLAQSRFGLDTATDQVHVSAGVQTTGESVTLVVFDSQSRPKTAEAEHGNQQWPGTPAPRVQGASGDERTRPEGPEVRSCLGGTNAGSKGEKQAQARQAHPWPG